MEINKIITGDCIEKLKELPDNSIESVVTDPPYELGFMGKLPNQELTLSQIIYFNL